MYSKKKKRERFNFGSTCYVVINLLFMVIDKTPQVCTGPFVFEILRTVLSNTKIKEKFNRV